MDDQIRADKFLVRLVKNVTPKGPKVHTSGPITPIKKTRQQQVREAAEKQWLKNHSPGRAYLVHEGKFSDESKESAYPVPRMVESYDWRGLRGEVGPGGNVRRRNIVVPQTRPATRLERLAGLAYSERRRKRGEEADSPSDAIRYLSYANRDWLEGMERHAPRSPRLSRYGLPIDRVPNPNPPDEDS